MFTPHGLSGDAIDEEHVWLTRKSLALCWSFFDMGFTIAIITRTITKGATVGKVLCDARLWLKNILSKASFVRAFQNLRNGFKGEL